MTRIFKTLGLALFAVFALSAVAASAASATTFHLTTESDSTTLTTEAKTNLVFNSAAGTLICEKITTDTTVGTAETEVTLVNLVLEGNCTFTHGGTTTPLDIEMNGCDFLLTITEEKVAGEKYSGPLHIKCPAGKPIEAKLTIGGVKLNCLLIHEQTPTAPTVDYTNEGTGTTMDVKLKSTVEGITYEALGPACGPTAENNDMTLTGEVTLTGENPTTGAHIGITVS